MIQLGAGQKADISKTRLSKTAISAQVYWSSYFSLKKILLIK